MRLRRHLSQVQDLLATREEIVVEQFRSRENLTGRELLIQGRLRFWDGSLLEFSEALIAQGVILLKTDYSYHYQGSDGTLVFRYDNAPHHRQVATFPHHKHTTEGIVDSKPPHLVDVLRQIDAILYRPAS